MHCSKCGAVLPEGAKFCTACGTAVIEAKHTAEILRRLANCILDSLIGNFFCLFLYVSVWGLVRLLTATAAVSETNVLVATFNLLVPLLIASSFYINIPYYVFFEAIWQRTPGKWATGTKVVTLDGKKPGFLRILGRNLLRLIPFEGFSFLVGSYPFGWHDQLSGTMVVPASYSAEDAAAINPKDKGKTHVIGILIGIVAVMFLIIPILGILSGVILASLDSARSKSNDTKTVEQVVSLRSQAEIYSVQMGSYSGFCNSGEAISVKSEIPQLACNDSGSTYAISVPLNSGKYWCVDSTGASLKNSSALGSATQCPSE